MNLTADDVVETIVTLYIGKKRLKLPAQTIVKIVQYMNGSYVIATNLGTFSIRADYLRLVGPIKSR